MITHHLHHKQELHTLHEIQNISCGRSQSNQNICLENILEMSCMGDAEQSRLVLKTLNVCITHGTPGSGVPYFGEGRSPPPAQPFSALSSGRRSQSFKRSSVTCRTARRHTAGASAGRREELVTLQLLWDIRNHTAYRNSPLNV